MAKQRRFNNDWLLRRTSKAFDKADYAYLRESHQWAGRWNTMRTRGAFRHQNSGGLGARYTPFYKGLAKSMAEQFERTGGLGWGPSNLGRSRPQRRRLPQDRRR